MGSSPARWYRSLPPKDRQSLLTLLVFAVLLAFFVTLTVTERKYNATIRVASMYPGFAVKVGNLASAVAAEADAAITFSLRHTEEALYDEMVKTWAIVDRAYRDSFDYVEKLGRASSGEERYPLADGGTIMTEQGLGEVLNIRSQLVFGEVVFDSQETRNKYLAVLRRLAGLMATISHTFREGVDYTALVASNTMMGVADAFLAVEYHSALYFDHVARGDRNASVSELKMVLLGLLSCESISETLVRPLLGIEDRIVFDVKAAAFDLAGTMHTFLAQATKLQVLPEEINLLERNSIMAVRKVMDDLAAELSALQERLFKNSFSSRYFWYLACCVLCGVAFLVSAVELLSLRLFGAKGSALRRRNAGIMHDVLVRVAEYVEEIATFSLAPKPPPLTMADRKVSIVEVELKYLLGALKTIAPSLPPLLFPGQLRRLAAEYSDVKDPATMVLAPPFRENLRDEKMRIQSTQDPHPYLERLAEKTDLQERICEAALMIVSLTSFHDLGSLEKRRFTVEYYERILSIVEECVYQHGGILHSVTFDKAVAVWHVDESGGELMEDAYGRKARFCELAATCGLTLANRLSHLRAQKARVRENFPIHIGVVGGTVDIGIFGSEAAKTVGMFGPPVIRGMLVAQANGFHMTSVACDDYICRAIQRMYYCKPIELLPCGGCAYQIVSETAHDAADLEMQLLAYTKAFELFEQKHYKGALKAFRAYTKQYGYDSSVERIQYLITNMQT